MREHLRIGSRLSWVVAWLLPVAAPAAYLLWQPTLPPTAPSSFLLRIMPPDCRGLPSAPIRSASGARPAKHSTTSRSVFRTASGFSCRQSAGCASSAARIPSWVRRRQLVAAVGDDAELAIVVDATSKSTVTEDLAELLDTRRTQPLDTPLRKTHLSKRLAHAQDVLVEHLPRAWRARYGAPASTAKLRQLRAFLMPEEGLEPPTRGL
jgi:hypothetical protein